MGQQQTEVLYMNKKREALPFITCISFNKLLEQYEQYAESEDKFLAAKAKRILEVQEPYPELRSGFTDFSLLKKYQKPIATILEDIFTEVLTSHEIKAASIPFKNIVFNGSERFKQILSVTGKNFDLSISNPDEVQVYILACIFILNHHYNYNIDYERPLYYDIPDKNGTMRYYKILYNTDFMEVIPTEKAVSVPEKEIEALLDSFDNVALWKEKFPPESYILKGFVISSMVDVTADRAISRLKTVLSTRYKRFSDDFINDFEKQFRILFGIPDLHIGFTIYFSGEDRLELASATIKSYLLGGEESKTLRKLVSPVVYEKLVRQHLYFSVSDVDKVLSQTEENTQLYKVLKKQEVKSAILAPITHQGKVLALLELVSSLPQALNSINANKLTDIMPYIAASVIRSYEEEKNQIKAIIQKECTSIHPSVYWKFEKEARRFLKSHLEDKPAIFREIVFKDVYALYGQIDIKNSSLARNEAIQKDLITQLSLLTEIFREATKAGALPIYDEINFRIKSYLNEVKEQLKANTEQKILNFLEGDIHPVLKHLKNKDDELKTLVKNYYDALYDNSFVYRYRKDYDDTVTLINKRMAEILNEKQAAAQKMFPHFFERYKTDGVEHNMYIGASIANTGSFNEIYLQNLRLWQLQVMCELEREFYILQPRLPVQLEVTSLVLVYSTPISIRYRMEEHHFDVDGTYNARYEVIKKRLDKAKIKDKNERITQKGKIVIIYSQKKDEKEYLRYIQLLQAKEFITENVETFAIEPLQGISGLKTIRIEVLHKEEPKK